MYGKLSLQFVIDSIAFYLLTLLQIDIQTVINVFLCRKY